MPNTQAAAVSLFAATVYSTMIGHDFCVEMIVSEDDSFAITDWGISAGWLKPSELSIAQREIERLPLCEFDDMQQL